MTTKVYDLNKIPWIAAISSINKAVIDRDRCTGSFWMKDLIAGATHLRLTANEFDKSEYLPIKGWLDDKGV